MIRKDVQMRLLMIYIYLYSRAPILIIRSMYNIIIKAILKLVICATTKGDFHINFNNINIIHYITL